MQLVKVESKTKILKCLFHSVYIIVCSQNKSVKSLNRSMLFFSRELGILIAVIEINFMNSFLINTMTGFVCSGFKI